VPYKSISGADPRGLQLFYQVSLNTKGWLPKDEYQRFNPSIHEVR
jgi:hypothetical protein